MTVPTFAKSRENIHAKFLAVACLASLLPGCCIPGLRGPKPGPARPSRYAWNNGRAFEQYDQQQNPPATPAPAQDGSPPPTAETQTDDQQVVETASFQRPTTPAEQPASVAPADGSLTPATAADAQPQGDVQPEDLPPVDQAIGDSGAPEVVPPPILENPAAPSNVDGAMELAVTPESACLPRDVFFSDPYLLGLIQQALVGNQELRILAEEINIARNESYARSGEYRPFVTLGGAAGVEKPGRHTRAGAVEEQLEVAPGKGFPEPLPDFLVAANVSWEIDIWHKLRNAQRAATLRYLATSEGRNFVVTRLVAEVSESYYDLLALDNRRETLNLTIEIQRASLKIAQAKKDAGRGTELAVRRFEAEVRKNESELSVVMQEIIEVENRINFLVGRYPQPVDRITTEIIDLNLTALNAGVPSQLLQRRADIRQAERQVAAAGLDVRVARARFYPSLTLTAGLGWNAFSTGYLFRTPESLIYGVAGELVGPLINRRAIKADYASANAMQLQAIYNYQKTVLQAHIEVVNYMTKVENYHRSIEAKRMQLDSLAESVNAALQLFENARAEYVEVLLAQRELMEAKMQVIDIKREQLSAIVNAYQALGGGAF